MRKADYRRLARDRCCNPGAPGVGRPVPAQNCGSKKTAVRIRGRVPSGWCDQHDCSATTLQFGAHRRILHKWKCSQGRASTLQVDMHAAGAWIASEAWRLIGAQRGAEFLSIEIAKTRRQRCRQPLSVFTGANAMGSCYSGPRKTRRPRQGMVGFTLVFRVGSWRVHARARRRRSGL